VGETKIRKGTPGKKLYPNKLPATGDEAAPVRSALKSFLSKGDLESITN